MIEIGFSFWIFGLEIKIKLIKILTDYRGYRVRKLNKELKECKSKAGW